MFFKQFWGDSCTPTLPLYIRLCNRDGEAHSLFETNLLILFLAIEKALGKYL